MNSKSRSLNVFVFLATAALLILGSAQIAQAELAAVGPIHPENGFPIWYQDFSTPPLLLEQCLVPGFCLFDPAVDLPNPAAPVSFPGNFPEEIFWWTADAPIVLPGGRALLVLALEGAFGGGPVAVGDQVSFGRVRIRIDVPAPGGTYTVTHPYGVEVFTNVAPGRRAINMTRDIGIGAPGNFNGALGSDIGPFLVWDTFGLPPASGGPPAGFVGDPTVLHRVVGSPNGTNFFQIDGPNIGGPGVNTVIQRRFLVSGKIATTFGVAVNRATYVRAADGTGAVSVFATTAPGSTIQVSGTGIPTTNLVEEGAPAGTGKYFAHIPFTTLPASISALNTSDTVTLPATTANVTDVVAVTSAQYVVGAASGAGTLNVTAVSSDQLAPGPALRVVRPGVGIIGNLTAGTFSGALAFPPDSILVRSSAGGSDRQLVDISGAAAP